MSGNERITGRQIAAGRVLAGIGRERLAARAGVPVETLARVEIGKGRIVSSPEDFDAICQALEDLGIRFLPENGGGAGVRLKFTASEVRRIATLEGEGGIVGDDDI